MFAGTVSVVFVIVGGTATVAAAANGECCCCCCDLNNVVVVIGLTFRTTGALGTLFVAVTGITLVGADSGRIDDEGVAWVVSVEPVEGVEVETVRNEVTMGLKGFGGGGGGRTVLSTEESKVLKKSSDESSIVEGNE